MGIAERIEDIQNRIEKAALRAGRKREEITLMGVSKFHSPESVQEALEAGLAVFGESRVQEAREKFRPLKERRGLELHMIGSLQRNKAKPAAAFFDCIQSLDRDGLITVLGNVTAEREKPLRVLLEMHTGEESKTGYPDEDSLCRAAELVLPFPGLRLSGLMTMAPYTQDRDIIRKSFRTLVSARDKLIICFPGMDFSCLSMGMSNDFEIAVEEGSTLVRVGTGIFGERKA
jgi:pyridoxal phosphate enzyme (YggS family)